MSRLRSLRSLYGYALNSLNGPCGRVAEFLVDVRSWTVRNIVVDTGRFMRGGKVMLPMGVSGKPDPICKTIPVSLTKERIAEYPGLVLLFRTPQVTDSGAAPPEQLLLGRNLAGSPVSALDGDFGSIVDLLVDAESWIVYRIIVDSMFILPDYRVWMPTSWVHYVDIPGSGMYLNITGEKVMYAPRYDELDPDQNLQAEVAYDVLQRA